jgi:hypothetical protein
MRTVAAVEGIASGALLAGLGCEAVALAVGIYRSGSATTLAVGVVAGAAAAVAVAAFVAPMP